MSCQGQRLLHLPRLLDFAGSLEPRFLSYRSHVMSAYLTQLLEAFPTSMAASTGPVAIRSFLTAEGDWLRRALILEPRGFEAIVGAYLCEPADSDCVTGVVFFNNVACLNSCLHGTIGLVKTLEYLETITPGIHKIETPVGVIEATLSPDGTVICSLAG